MESKPAARATNKWKHHRRHDRARHGGQVVFKGRYGGNLNGVVRDISEAGVYITDAKPPNVGADILLYLQIESRPGRSKMCIVAGKVIRTGKPPEAPGFGVAFESKLSMSIVEEIRGYILRAITQGTGSGETA